MSHELNMHYHLIYLDNFSLGSTLFFSEWLADTAKDLGILRPKVLVDQFSKVSSKFLFSLEHTETSVLKGSICMMTKV